MVLVRCLRRDKCVEDATLVIRLRFPDLPQPNLSYLSLLEERNNPSRQNNKSAMTS